MGKVRVEFLSWLAGTLSKDSESSEIILEAEAGEDTTVRQILGDIAVKYPRFGELIFDPRNHKLSGKVAVFWNGRHLEMVNGLDTRLTDGDVLTLLPAIEGG